MTYEYRRSSGLTTNPDMITVYDNLCGNELTNAALPKGKQTVKITKVLKTKESEYKMSTIQVLTDTGALIVSNTCRPEDKATRLLKVIAEKGFAEVAYTAFRHSAYNGKTYNFGDLDAILNETVIIERQPHKGEAGYENTVQGGFDAWWDLVEGE